MDKRIEETQKRRKEDCKPRTRRCIWTPRVGKSAGRWFNETLIKGRRLCASVETFALAINATVHPTLTARRCSATIRLPREMERVPAGDYTCVT